MASIIYLESHTYIPPEGYRLVASGITIHDIDKYEAADLIIGYLKIREGRVSDVWTKC